jgi:hypothetical protein
MKMQKRRFLLMVFSTLFLWGCGTNQSPPLGKLSIGVVNLESNDQNLEQYEKLKVYLGFAEEV